MPIAHVILAGDLADRARREGPALTEAVTGILTAGLFAERRLVQVVVTEALVPPQGCAVLAQVFHRASERRDAATRARVAAALRDELEGRLRASARVRLIALDPDDIAAADTEEGDA